MNTLTTYLNILSLKAIFVAFAYTAVLILIFLDLWSGVRKAKANKEYISSHGFRRTVSKIARYFNMLLAVTVVDAVQMLAIFELTQNASSIIPIIPIFTILSAIFIGIIEIKSIYEKSDKKDKAKAAETAKIITEALKNADNKELIISILNTIKSKEN